jgi:hypothetical protein
MFLLAALAIHAPTSIERIDALVKAKDVASLTRLLDPLPKGARNPFQILAGPGAYDVGRFGWSAFELPTVDHQPGYVVVSTKLTSEDIGELVFQRDGDKLKFVPESETMGVRVDHHAFIIRFHPEQKRVEIVDKVEFSAKPGGRRFLVRMSPQYHMDRVQDGNGEPVSFKQAGGVVLLRRLPQTDFDYRFFYSATVDLPSYAGSIGPNEATLTNDYWYPMIARNPAPFETEVHAPANWTSVAQGELVSTQKLPTESVTKYRMDLPVTYYSVSSAPYRVVSRTVNGRRFTIWSLRMSQEDMEAQTELYPPILKFYERFAPFPFSGYGAVDSAVYGGGALEAYSFATYGGGLPDEEAHEPSHTWWGGIIDNTYLSSFWNESFAVYSDGLYHRNVPIGNLDERRKAFVQDGAGNPEFDKIPILGAGVDSGGVAGSLGYGKGSRVLQMMEQIVGTDEMIRIMHDWIAVHKKGEAGGWPEFMRVAERDAPKAKLESFFQDWLSRPGYARLSADFAYRDGATKIHLKWKGSRFRMPLLVLTRGKAGVDKYTLIDTIQGDDFSIPGPKPAVVSVDPFRQALRDVADDETPTQLATYSWGKRVVDPAHLDWLKNYGGQGPRGRIEEPLDGAFVVGSPDSSPIVQRLCDKVGFKVSGSQLTYKGTTIDLNKGAAVAIVDLGAGRSCVVGLGKTRLSPRPGRARLVLVDDLGRFLRGETEPKTKGNLTVRWP